MMVTLLPESAVESLAGLFVRAANKEARAAASHACLVFLRGTDRSTWNTGYSLLCYLALSLYVSACLLVTLCRYGCLFITYVFAGIKIQLVVKQMTFFVMSMLHLLLRDYYKSTQDAHVSTVPLLSPFYTRS
jgi:hypothetical protein